MDASYLLQKQKSKAIFYQKKTELEAKYPAVRSGGVLVSGCDLSGCATAPCPITYKSFEEKYLFNMGKNECNNCGCN